ncbi:MAG TPA: formyltetrahydrofolate deformylase [Glaciecola sp.]|jgi:formyltetrahydrofolate deformylase|nr:formyltetrahydrofolate deformylase [Glaciecola sp.]HAB80134.1 formyltetrahydrofolate deformylase [Glaciecola sp.]HAQ47711.1 formyltetrahydrofolate deformylase [Glaciecola sp.]HCF78107.1 formyltetrahydrofolate deformylase [Glaciecola sp.]
MQHSFRLTIQCPDQVGLVAQVSQFLAQYGATILEANHHTDLTTKRFFMRHEIQADSVDLDMATFEAAFTPIANKFNMEWKISDPASLPKVALLASHETHCLADILHRWHTGELNCDIPCIIANHEKIADIAAWYKVPFVFVDFKNQDKVSAFANIEDTLATYNIDTVVLARFMQILPQQMCEKWHGSAINIHHSFLPSFAGAKPYQQAYDRGVKLIGATCHYVTSDLDEGPIIEQQVMRISHSDAAQDMVRKGRDCEKTALANGLRYHLEDRVMIDKNKTIVFA